MEIDVIVWYVRINVGSSIAKAVSFGHKKTAKKLKLIQFLCSFVVKIGFINTNTKAKAYCRSAYSYSFITDNVWGSSYFEFLRPGKGISKFAIISSLPRIVGSAG